ncbi:hypothetical protein H1R20_g13424, partial [Candolleomyces eurysporus]
MVKGLTPLQHAQRLANIQKIAENRQKRQNSDSDSQCDRPVSNHDTENALIRSLESEVSRLKSRVQEKQLKINNKNKEINRRSARVQSLKGELKKARNALKMRNLRRMGTSNKKRDGSGSDKVGKYLGTVSLKEKGGAVSFPIRGVVRQLSALGIPESNTNQVIHTVGHGLGVKIEGDVSARTVGRIVAAGGLAAQVQIVDELQFAENGHTLSSDGTTIRHRNFESRHVTFSAPTYEDDPLKPSRTIKTRVLGLSTAVNHTSETQLHGLKEIIEKAYGVYNNSPLGQSKPALVVSFAANIRGLGSDHAEDQKKLGRGVKDWMIVSSKYLKGLEDHLVEAEQEKYDKQAMEEVIERFGAEAWADLSDEDREKAEVFVWAGCCMHKELNSVKGGARRMAEYWSTVDNTAPVKLMNQHKEMAVNAGSSEAVLSSFGDSGGVKLTSLAGAIFRHKDDKKGQQDTFKMYFENLYGYSIAFPDTSSTRFQSHCAAAAELIVHQQSFEEFLLFVRDKKDNKTFNHMELNVYKGLKDGPTLTELCVLSLYLECLGKPYMKRVRPGGDKRINALGLSELHKDIKAYCQSMATNPDPLLMFEDGDYAKAAFGGEPWDRPDVIYAVARLSPQLPHLRRCLSAFFGGSLEVWERLTAEFKEDGQISKLSKGDKENIFINATNDDNEGLLGSTRLMSRFAPRMNVSKINAKLMYSRNNTEKFIQYRMSDSLSQKYLMRLQREQEGMKLDKRRREEEIAYQKAEVEAKKQRAARAQEKIDAHIVTGLLRSLLHWRRSRPRVNEEGFRVRLMGRVAVKTAQWMRGGSSKG